MATTIGFAEDVNAPHPHKTLEIATASACDDSIYVRSPRTPRRVMTGMSGKSTSSDYQNKDGIYNLRDVSRPLSRTTSRARLSLGLRRDGGDDSDEKDDDPGLQRSGDFRHKEVFHGRLLMWLAYQSVGAIYGDIGTSPLYVYSSTFKDAPSKEDLVGVLSIVIWSLTLMVTLKYVLVILRADNDGEGGTFSTYSLLSRYVSLYPLPLAPSYPPKDRLCR